MFDLNTWSIKPSVQLPDKSILVLGDNHGYGHFIDSYLWAKQNFIDYIFQVGDFGLGWLQFGDSYGTFLRKMQFKHLLKNEHMPIVITCGGNHENYDKWYNRLAQNPQTNFVPLIKPISDSIPSNCLWAKRGSYHPDTNAIFMGGAVSVDSYGRTKFGKRKSWWAQEVPTRQEYDNFFENLENNSPTFLITHDGPACGKEIYEMPRIMIGDSSRYPDEVRRNIENILYASSNTSLKYWFHGHHHQHLILHPHAKENSCGLTVFNAGYHGQGWLIQSDLISKFSHKHTAFH